MYSKHKDLIFSLASLCIVIVTLFFVEDLFVFHSYNKIDYNENILEVETDSFSIKNFKVLSKHDSHILSVHSITLHNDIIENYENIDVLFNVNNNEELRYNIDLIDGVYEYQFDELEHEVDLLDNFVITCTLFDIDSNEISSKTLDNMELYKIHSTAKDYNLSGASVNKNYMNLGKLLFLHENDKYSDITIEYRYIDEEIDDYKVFYKVDTTIEEYINSDEIYFYNNNTIDNLLEQEFSIVIMLTGENIDRNVFSIDLEIEDYDDER